MYIFGYGSLLSINSAQKTFKRELKQDDFIPVTLQGYEKIWNSIEYIVFENEKEIKKGIFLNLKKDFKSKTNGILLKISPEEFDFLKLREKSYSCISLNPDDIIGFKTKENIYTFITTNKEKIANQGDKNCFIPRKYISLLEEGAKAYEEKFSKEFIESYQNFLFDIKDGVYKFSDPIQNKFAKDGLKSES